MSVRLRLGFDPDFAPLTYLGAGRPGGRAIEIVRAAGRRAGIGIHYVAVGLSASDGVAELRLEGFACMAVTPGRTNFTFSVPYMTTAAALFFALREARQEAGRAPGAVTVVTPRGGPLFALLSEKTSAERQAPEEGPITVARVVPGTDYRECLERVLRGDADAAALNAEVGRALVARLFPGAFFDLAAPLPDLGLAVALTGECAGARRVLDDLDPALGTASRY